MQLGSPGFRGNRLVDAREVRGVTGKALADVVGVSAGSISHYENGRQTPSGEVLSAMASALGFPEKFFFGRDRPTRQGTVFFRSGATLPQRAKNAVMWRIGWIQEILEYLNQYLELPPVHIFDAGFGDDPTAISVEDIERAAADLRTFWGLKDGAISDTVLLAELHGIVVSRLRLNEDREDALSEPKIDNYRDCILLNADKNCAVRSRLDVGHELGHLVLHRHVPQDVKEIHHNLIEKQAFRFAGALLLPATSFFSDFYHSRI